MPDIPLGITILVTVLRFLAIFTLLLLLLNPALSLLYRIKEKPKVIVAQDNTLSLLKNKDSLYYRNEYKESLDEMIAQLQDKYEIVPITFGATVKKNGKIDFSEKHTDLAAVFDYAGQQFATRQPEAMILLSDGIYNSGVNPRYKIPAFPVYTVALGDTTCYPDVYIRNIEADKYNFLHTIFPVKVNIAALKQKGQRVKCVLRENGNAIGEKTIEIDRDNFLAELIFDVEARRTGVIRYSISLETGFQERSTENNRADTWIHILDNSGEIAFFASAPHPDLAAIVNAMSVSGVWHLKEHRWEEKMDTLKANLIILHNPDPGLPEYEKLMREAQRRKIAIWYILTDRKHITDFARFGKHYSVNFNPELNEYVIPVVNRDFPYFEFSENEMAAYSAFPPLVLPFGQLDTRAGRVLFNQKIKNTPTSNGMLAFYETDGNRICYLWGEGLWRWRLYSYGESGNHELFNTLIHKIVGYMAAKKGTDRFIHDVKPLYGESEEVVINAELYNDSYELINTPDVKLDLKHGEQIFSYLLNRNANKYKINLGNLPAGKYTYRIATNLKGENFEKKGTFFVRSSSIELNDIVANRELLKEIAERSGGMLMERGDLNHLVNVLNSDHNLKPVYKSEVKFIELRGLEILGLILLLLLCAEWFLLKYFAG